MEPVPPTPVLARWDLPGDAAVAGRTVDEGFLVMGRRGSKVLQMLSLETLDAQIDRQWLAHEIGQLIAADAAHAGAYSPR